MALRRFLLLLVTVLHPLSAAEPSWRTPGSCVTPTGTLCRTLEYDTIGWGLFGIERYRLHETEAFGSDGSAMIRVAKQSFRFYFIASQSYDRARIVVPKKRQTFEVERTLKEFQELGGVWRFFENWEDDPDCGTRASQDGLAYRKTGVEVSVNGVRAVEYASENYFFSETIALAPSLGCTIIALTRSERSLAGFPVARIQSRLSSVAIREPDRELFTIPPGYSERHYYREGRSVKEWPYIWLDAFHGNTESPEP